MGNPTLEQRVSELERKVARLMANSSASSSQKDWRRSLGMFAGDEMMKRIDAAGQAIREKERQRARQGRPRKARTKK